MGGLTGIFLTSLRWQGKRCLSPGTKISAGLFQLTRAEKIYDRIIEWTNNYPYVRRDMVWMYIADPLLFEIFVMGIAKRQKYTKCI